MKITWKNLSFAGLALLLSLNLLAAPAATIAQGHGVALAPASTSDGSPACWIAVGTKLYYVEKDDSTVLKVKASGSMAP